MKKKLFGMLLAGALIASQCVTAFAAGSKDAGTEVPGLSGSAPEGYTMSTDVSETISELPSERREEAAVEISQANSGNLDAIADTLSSSEDKAILNNASVLTKVFDLKGKAGKVTFTVANLPEKTSAVYALHLAANGEWEIIPATFDPATGKVTVNFKSLSPVVLIAKTEADTGSGRKHKSSSSSDDSSSGSGAPETTADGLIASPRTGMVSDWTLWMGMAVVLLGISGAAFRRTRA